MDKFVKNFIVMSIVYLGVAVFIGIWLLWDPSMFSLKFIHSHLMMLGWVSMMIYGVGYHILPRFVGKLIKSKALGEAQFWLANVGLVGMMVFYYFMQHYPANQLYKTLTVLFGVMEAVSIIIFFYNMMTTLYGKEPEAA